MYGKAAFERFQRLFFALGGALLAEFYLPYELADELTVGHCF
jgi:hypothetical protein